LTFAATNTTVSITSTSLAGNFKQAVAMALRQLLVGPPLVVQLPQQEVVAAMPQRLRATPSLRPKTCAMSQTSMTMMFRSDLSAEIISL
jgi:hypothetical protein